MESAETASSERCISANIERLSESLSTQSIRMLNSMSWSVIYIIFIIKQINCENYTIEFADIQTIKKSHIEMMITYTCE